MALIWVITTKKQNHSIDQPIKIGIIGPLSGPAGLIGEEVANSIKLASSTSFQLIFEDDQCDTKKAVSLYLKLTQQDVHVFYVSCSGSVLALAPLAKTGGNLILTAYAGSSEIRKTGDEVIRFIPDALSIAGAMANYALKLPVDSKIGLLYEAQDYSKSVAMTLQDKLGAKIISQETYSATDNTFRTQLMKLKSQGINNLFYVPTSGKAVGLVYKELDVLNYRPLLIGDVNACEYTPTPKEFGLKSVCFDAGFTTETQAYKDFLVVYKTQYGIESASPFYDSVTYDIFKLIDVYAKSHSTNNIASGLKTYFLGGVTGGMSSYSFTKNGEVMADQYLKMFEK